MQSSSDLDPDWFNGYATVGLTAGTSTLERTIDEVHRALVWIGSHDVATLPGRFEDAIKTSVGPAIAGGVVS